MATRLMALALTIQAPSSWWWLRRGGDEVAPVIRIGLFPAGGFRWVFSKGSRGRSSRMRVDRVTTMLLARITGTLTERMGFARIFLQ